MIGPEPERYISRDSPVARPRTHSLPAVRDSGLSEEQDPKVNP